MCFHRNTRDGEMPYRLATAETLLPGALASSSRLSVCFCLVVKRRRWPLRGGDLLREFRPTDNVSGRGRFPEVR